jgi:DNA-binding protein YbaB
MDLAGFRARVESMEAEFERLRAESGAVQRRVSAVRAEATSEDGLVTAEVDPRGRLVHLEIDPRIFRRPDARRLADAILKAVRDAETDADAQVAKAFEDMMPPEKLQYMRAFDMEAIMRGMQEEMDGLVGGVDQ